MEGYLFAKCICKNPEKPVLLINRQVFHECAKIRKESKLKFHCK